MQFLDGLDNGNEFFPLGAIDEIRAIFADHGLVGGNGDGFQSVDLAEFHSFGLGCAGHARKLVVHAEVVLERNAGQRLIFRLDVHPFLGFQSLMQSIAETAPFHEAAGELVHDDHLAFLADDVVHVALVGMVGTQRLLDMVLEHDVLRVEQVFDGQDALALSHALLGEQGSAGLFIHGEMLFGLQTAHDLVHLPVQAGGLVPRAGDDQRGACLVDEDGVHFVHDGEIVPALHQLFLVELHVVTQVVEAEFVVRAVSDVGIVCGLAFLVGEAVYDDSHGEAEPLVQLSHPFGVAAGEVVVYRDHMHASAGDGIEHHRQGGNQSLAFTCLHFRYLALVQHDAAHELHVIMTHAEDAARGFPHKSKDFGQQFVETAPFLLGLAAVFRETGGQLLVGQSLHFGLQGVDFSQQGAKRLEIALIARAEYFSHQVTEHGVLRSKIVEVQRVRHASAFGKPCESVFPGKNGVSSYFRVFRRMKRRRSRANPTRCRKFRHVSAASGFAAKSRSA